MNKVQTLLCLVFMVSCCVTLTTSLSCYICNSSLDQDCKNASFTMSCNPTLAEATKTYALQFLTTNSSLVNQTSSTYHCVYDFISTAKFNHSYLGCAYSTMDICDIAVPNARRHCGWCSGNRCNPANRAIGSFLTVAVTILLAFMAKYLYN